MAGKTEWEDALIKHGIMAAPEVKDTDDEIQLKHIQKMSERDELADKNLDELDELEDDFESDIIEKYRYAVFFFFSCRFSVSFMRSLCSFSWVSNSAQRFKEMQEKQAKEKFGSYSLNSRLTSFHHSLILFQMVIQVKCFTSVRQISFAKSPTPPMITLWSCICSTTGLSCLHVLFPFSYSDLHPPKNSVPSCRIINAALDRLAARKRAVKFVKIIGSEAIKNWPESNCPAILVYSKTNIWRQFIGIGTLGGNSTNAEILEWILAENGVFETELEQDPRDKIQRMNIKRAGAGAAIRFGNRNNEDDEDDY
jgi:hypothetical protein